MAGKVGGGDEDTISDINVTPLVDIMLVLVIILMVTAEFTKYKTVNIALPKINAVAMKREPHRVTITVKNDGRVYWNDKIVKDMATVKPRLKAEKKAYPRIAVILRAEGDTEYSNLLGILDIVKEAGISKVGLAGEDKKKKRKRRG